MTGITLRRLRQDPHIRALTRGARPHPEQFIQPLFVVEGIPEREVIPTLGSKEAIYGLANVLERESVAVPVPSYPVYQRGALFAGKQVLELPLLEASGWLPDLSAVDWDRVALLWLNYPNNPTGATAPLEFYEAVAELARRHGFVLASDEAYSEIYFGEPPVSALQVSDLTNVLAQDLRASGGDFCGVVSDTNFGKPTLSLAYDPATLNGWGTRPFQWEFSTSVQHQILPNVSVDFGYFRRWYGNFGVTDNLNLSPADYEAFSVTAPSDQRLPGGGGYTVGGFLDVVPSKAAVVPNNYFTLARNYGKQIDRWNGIDLTVNTRVRAGMTLQGGLSTGHQTTDFCDVQDPAKAGNRALVEMLTNANGLASLATCHMEQNWLPQVKFLGSYTIPKIDVQVGASFQSIPGVEYAAQYAAPNTDLARPVSQGGLGRLPVSP